MKSFLRAYVLLSGSFVGCALNGAESAKIGLNLKAVDMMQDMYGGKSAEGYENFPYREEALAVYNSIKDGLVIIETAEPLGQLEDTVKRSRARLEVLNYFALDPSQSPGVNGFLQQIQDSCNNSAFVRYKNYLFLSISAIPSTVGIFAHIWWLVPASTVAASIVWIIARNSPQKRCQEMNMNNHRPPDELPQNQTLAQRSRVMALPAFSREFYSEFKRKHSDEPLFVLWTSEKNRLLAKLPYWRLSIRH